MALLKREWAAVILALAVTGLGNPAAVAPGRYIVEFVDGLGADSVSLLFLLLYDTDDDYCSLDRRM